MKYDVVIIGSGLGGLECASVLSRMGRSVLVLEKEAQAGGCLQSYRRHGMAYDTGFHYVGGLDEGQSLHAAFNYLGLLNLPWQRLDEHFDRVTIGEREYPFAQGFDAFADTLAAEFPAEREALRSYADLLRRSGEQQLAALNPRHEEDTLTGKLLEANAYRYLEETFRSSELINALSGTSLKMELRRESLPLFSFLHGNVGFIESSWRLKGNGSLMVRALTDGIRSNGGEIVCKAEVEELIEENGRLVRAVCSNGESYEGDLFISDTHPAVTCALLKRSEKMKNSYRNRIMRMENTFGMFTVSLRVKPDTIRYFNWNRYVYKRPDVWTFYLNDSVDGLLISCRTPEDGGEYTRQIDLLTPMTKKKWEAWTHTRTGRRGEDYKAMKASVADECVSLAERFVPGLRDSIEERYTSTPLTYRDYTYTPEGAAYGLRKDCNAAATALLSTRTPVANLFLTGQSVMLHGVHGVTMTALHTCAEIVGKERIWDIVKN